MMFARRLRLERDELTTALQTARQNTRDADLRAAAATAAARRTHHRNERLVERLEAAHRKHVRLTARLHRALRAVAWWRRRAAELERLVAAQQAQLDELMGLNTSAVAAGARWQERRGDRVVRTVPPAEPAGSPSDRLPTREPGEVAS